MLSRELKKTIQAHYSQLLENKNLTSRQGQKVMIAEIANLLAGVETDEEGQRATPEAAVLAVEAGTGTGKTIAYLVPAVALARALDKKLVLATATVALQEQVVYKDIPDLLRHGGMDFTYALAKGKGRYLCLAKLDNLLKADSSRGAMRDLYGMELEDPGQADLDLCHAMLDALQAGRWKGDRDDWPGAIDDNQWRRVAVEHGQCSGSRCSHFSNCCFFRSREHLHKADCIVANHDLVLADLSLGGGVVLPAPADSIYIFDEAHHLPAKGISHFSHFLRLRATGKWLEQSAGVFARLAKDSASGGPLGRAVEEAGRAAQEAGAGIQEHFPVFECFAAGIESARGGGNGDRYTFPGGRVDAGVQAACQELEPRFALLSKHLGGVLELISQCLDADGGELGRPEAETWYPLIGAMTARAEAGRELWRHFAMEDAPESPPHARWLTFSRPGYANVSGGGPASANPPAEASVIRGASGGGPASKSAGRPASGQSGETEIALSCSPIVAAEALAATLWRDAFAVLLTSATLSALGRFDFLQMRAGLPESTRCVRIPSPFDFPNAVVLRIPSGGFDPSDAQAHTRAIIAALPEILDSRGGSLVLFSSRRQMSDVLSGLEGELAGRVLCQDDYSKQELLRRHREVVDAGKGSVIFGLASLTEGIDLPGDYCTHVVIAKIPFAVPDDPVEATLGEWIKGRGKNPFIEVSVPEAAMRLIQGCGRLLRTERDSGTITILDERLLTRRYGKAILDSLPPYRREVFHP